MGKTGVSKILILPFCLLLLGVAGNAYSAHYKTDRPWETDSILVAWLIKYYVDKDAVFSSIPPGERIEKEFSINTPYSPLRRDARHTAFDAAARIFDVNSECIDKIRPLIRILEMTPWRKHEHLEAMRFEKELALLFPVEPGKGNLEDAFSYINSYCDSHKPSAVSLAPVTFIALIDDSWNIVTMQNNTFSVIQTQQEPHTFDHDTTNKQTVYIGSDKSVRFIKNGQEQLLLSPGKDAYTQPAFSINGEAVYLVKLIDGNSVNTDIVRLNLQSKTINPVVTQRSTQLDPFLNNDEDLYYSNVSCVEGCGKIIQEIWQKKITANKANQLTMLNTLSHQPSVDPQGNYLFFSSNKNGHYHIWRLSLKSGTHKQLTFGDVTDSFPAAKSDGSAYFIRSVRGRNMLMEVDSNGSIQELNCPDKYHKIRELKVN